MERKIKQPTPPYPLTLAKVEIEVGTLYLSNGRTARIERDDVPWLFDLQTGMGEVDLDR